MTALAQRSVMLRWLWTPAALVLLLVLICLLASLGPGSLQRTVTDALIKLIVVVGLYIFIGNTGVISFGQTAFMAIGAYMSAWLTMTPALKRIRFSDLPDFIATAQLPVLAAAPISAVVAAVVALVLGFPLMRLSGISASIGTFAMLAVVIAVYGNWSGLTGGKSSLVGVPVETGLWTGLLWAAMAIVIAWAFQRSRTGLLLRGSREDLVAARASGVDVHRLRLVAFMVSAFVVGLGGHAYAHFLGVLTVDAFFLDITFITIGMLVIGGMNSLSGAVLGVIVVSALLDVVRRMEGGMDLGAFEIPSLPGLSQVVLAVAMLLILVFRPAGLMGDREIAPPVGVRRPPSGRGTRA